MIATVAWAVSKTVLLVALSSPGVSPSDSESPLNYAWAACRAAWPGPPAGGGLTSSYVLDVTCCQSQ